MALRDEGQEDHDQQVADGYDPDLIDIGGLPIEKLQKGKKWKKVWEMDK